jgi:hypothetical protein
MTEGYSYIHVLPAQVDVFSFGVLAYELLGRTLMSAGMGPKDIDAALEHLKKVSWVPFKQVFAGGH